MKNFLIFLILVFTIPTKIEAQVSLEPKSIPSPNAASLGIFGEIPIGYYTGTPDISIPLYEIELDGKKIPISLSYHASGIKVSQEASWVGMGWALNVGGCIMRSVQGWDDFGSHPLGYYFTTNPPTPTENNDITASTNEFQKYDDIRKNLIDAEPDLFFLILENIREVFLFLAAQKIAELYLKL